MSKSEPWKALYGFLVLQAPGSLISWEQAETVSGSPIRKSRGALTRAKQELELFDNRTIKNQCIEGFYVEVM